MFQRFTSGAALTTVAALAICANPCLGASNAGLQTGPQFYQLSIGAQGTPIDSLIDMQQGAAARASAPASPAVRAAPIAPRQAVAAPQPTGQFRIAMGWSPSPLAAAWIASAVAHAPTLQTGSILVIDATAQLRAAYNWSGGSISRIDMPALNAGSAAALSPILTVQAATLTQVSASGAASLIPTPRARVWQQRSFQVASTAPISASLALTRSVGAISLGPNIRGGTVDIAMDFGPERPDLSAPFQHALQVGGQLADRPTQITLHLLGLDLRTEIASVNLANCSVTGVRSAPAATGTPPATVVTIAFSDAALGITQP
jgi:hypothetical protein